MSLAVASIFTIFLQVKYKILALKTEKILNAIIPNVTVLHK